MANATAGGPWSCPVCSRSPEPFDAGDRPRGQGGTASGWLCSLHPPARQAEEGGGRIRRGGPRGRTARAWQGQRTAGGPGTTSDQCQREGAKPRYEREMALATAHRCCR